ncbi:hypothetical protein Ancab_018648, partial [Ancistrocladus abbreviatus]
RNPKEDPKEEDPEEDPKEDLAEDLKKDLEKEMKLIEGREEHSSLKPTGSWIEELKEIVDVEEEKSNAESCITNA